MTVEEAEEEAEEGVLIVPLQSNIRSNIKVAKLQKFNGKVRKILGFLITCKLYIKMRIRNTTVKEQVQWVLSYVQRELYQG